MPGGLGVFESVIVLLARAPAGEVLGALLAYRAVYYLMPLGIAALLLALTELAERQHRLIRTVRLLGGTLNQVAPSILAAAVFIGGAVLLFAGAVPEWAPRLALLRAMVPEWVVELSHLVGSIAGVGLLLLSQALLRRLELAYRWSLLLVAAGLAASVFKGFDYGEMVVLLVVGVALYPSRALFYRHAPLLGDRLGPAWLTAIAITLAAAAWLGFLSYKNVNYSHALWWQFAFDANAPRFLRAALAVGVVGLLFLLALLFRPAPPLPGRPGPAALSEAARIVRRSPRAAAGLALLGDKPLLFDDGRDGFLSYGVRGQSWVALGDPVGPPGAAAELVWSCCRSISISGSLCSSSARRRGFRCRASTSPPRAARACARRIAAPCARAPRSSCWRRRRVPPRSTSCGGSPRPGSPTRRRARRASRSASSMPPIWRISPSR